MLKKTIILSLFVTVAAPASADIAVIVNKNNTSSWTESSPKDFVKNIFLSVREKFPDGTIAKPVDQNQGRSIRQQFYLKVAGKDESKMNVYWSNLIFTGNGRPPQSVGTDSDVKRAVSEDPRGIGYIDSSQVDNTVKVIYTIPN